MKNKQQILVTLLMLGLLAACGKSSDPAASNDCSFTFKGTKYTITGIVVCTSVGTAEAIGGGTGSSGVTLNVSRDTDDATLNAILFSIAAGSANAYFSGDGVGTAVPSITVSGKTWTFSGHAVNTPGDEGDFTGKCTCTN